MLDNEVSHLLEHLQDEVATEQGYVPGTTSRASIASLYSMKPKPFISLISVISPVPWVLKWFSTSALVATVHEVQSANSVELSESPQAQAPAPTAVDQCQGDCVHHNAGLRDRSKCDRNEAPMRCRSGQEDQRTMASHIHSRASWACSARVSCRAQGSQGREREMWNAISGELKEAYRCAGGCQGRGAVQRVC
jgi:hypothetical protein